MRILVKGRASLTCFNLVEFLVTYMLSRQNVASIMLTESIKKCATVDKHFWNTRQGENAPYYVFKIFLLHQEITVLYT